MKKAAIAALTLLSILIIACGNTSSEEATKRSAGEKSSRMGERPGRMGTASAIPVEISFVVKGDISSYLMYSSTLETEQTVNIYSQIAGLVEKLFVEEGQWVEKGQPLLQLEQREYLLAAEKAKVAYEKQKADFQRLTALKNKNLLSDEEYENARLTLKQAELDWKQAELNLDYTIVRSPINGVVGERLVNLGDRIQPTTNLFVISNLSQKVVKVFVPQNEMANVYRNQPAVITSDVLPEVQFSGWVKRISPIVDAQSGTFKVTVGVKDPQGQLKPGMFVNVQLIVDTHRDTPIIPKSALIYENERSFFFILKNDTAIKVELQRGFEDAEKVELLNPIPPGTPVVVVGQNGLKDGSRVRVIDVSRYAWQSNWPEALALKYTRPAARSSVNSPDQRRPSARKPSREPPGSQ